MHINQFELSTLGRLLLRKKKRIVVNAVIAAVVGFLLGWCIPKEYYSEASIIPESNEMANMGNASALASMAGISLGGGVDAIGPELYPNVVQSNRFVVDLLYTTVQTHDAVVRTTLLKYLTDYSRMPFWGYAKVGLTKFLKMLVPPHDQKEFAKGDRIDPERMSQEEAALIEGVKYTLGCQINEKSGVIYVSYQCQDPLVAKTVVDTLTQRLQQFIIDYRTSKARVDLEHYQQLAREAKAEYDRALKAYASYCDSHMGGTLLEAYNSERDALENELQLALTAYTRMKQQVQVEEGKVQEKTPAFTILERATVPSRHASPHKMLMAIMWAFLAGVGTIGWYYVRLLLGKEQ